MLAVGVTAALASGGTARHAYSRASAVPLAQSLAAMRLATAKYATNLNRAKADGYRIITPMIPDMGIHYMNAKISGFDVSKPPILVYQKRGNQYLLGALEWVFTAKPAKPPLPGARYGAFGAACHYVDGTFVPAMSQDDCAKTSPKSGAKFGFWHPNLVTLHVWLWYQNPGATGTGRTASTTGRARRRSGRRRPSTSCRSTGSRGSACSTRTSGSEGKSASARPDRAPAGA